MWRSHPERPRQKRPPLTVTIHFRGSILGGEFGGLPEMAPIRRLLERSARGLAFSRDTSAIVARSMVRMRGMRALGRLVELLNILRVLAEAPFSRPLSSKPIVAREGAGDRDRIDRVCRFMTENAGHDLGLPEAAAAAHLSVPAFTRFFKKCTGRTFVEHLTELRVGTACRLLLETDRAASEIGLAAGFSSLPNFYRRFRKLKGMSPRAFRRQFSAP
jgi:AraC-like DNA-binding protein